MEKIIKKIFMTTFILIIFIFMIGTLLNNETISETERRKLATYPKVSIKNLISKKYYDKLTDAFKDQLFLRNRLIEGYFLFNFQHYFGDVVIGNNKQLYSASTDIYSDYYYEELKQVTDITNEVANNINAKFIYLSIPRKDAYMRKDLPKNYNSSVEIYNRQVKTVKENLNENIIFIDALEVFENNNIYNCYYSNDHHITPRCAYLLYDEINKYTGVESYKLEDEFTIKKTIVNGAYNRQLGQKIKSDKEDLYLIPKHNIEYTRYENNKISNKKVYGKGITYEDAYMEGDTAYTKVVTNNKNNKKILFVGSSYTNILEALAVPSYEEMLSIDYRHNKSKKSISEYVDENSIDYVIFIPAQSTNSFSISQIQTHLGK